MINTTFIDQKYIRFLSGRLKSFTDKGNGVFEFTHQCESPDSRKRRGYFYKKGTGYNFFCHNCQESTKFFKFLQKEDMLLYKEYQLEVFKDSMAANKKSEPDKTPDKKEEIRHLIETTGLIPYSELPKTHPAWKYVLKRKLPESLHSDIYYCRDFFPWAAQFNKAFAKTTVKEPRLILPYRNRNGDIVGFTCRAYGKSERKYIEIKITPEAEMIYGLDRVNTAKAIIAVEGPIDSMFLPNAIAVGGASYRGDFFTKYKHSIIVVPDNDWKRNKDVLKQIETLARGGYKIALLPDEFKSKDINHAIETEEHTAEDITNMIYTSVKHGPELLLDIAFRRKC
jgi:hypothetical protein